ncbi:MAG: hypothetical protein GY821_12885 [Gammaproteobacteria bacterium]|nr:hypothetical protein [Gammaproteobacteria bacterium]
MKKIGTAKYNNHHIVDLLWDDKAKGRRRIMARAFNETGYFPTTENFFDALEDAIKNIPKEFTNWNIFKKEQFKIRKEIRLP